MSKSVNLIDWTTVTGGTYNYWTIDTGLLSIGQTFGTPVICNPSAIPEINEAQQIQIFPNPTDGMINITIQQPCEKSTIKLICNTGQTVYERKNFSGNQIMLDISSFINGLYFIEISQVGDVFRSKIIKQ
jgi:hypothetical protein